VRKQAYLVALILLAGCAQTGRHHRGGPWSEAMRTGAGGPRTPRPTRSESAVATAAPDAILFAGFDLNGDLLIGAAELTGGITREFTRADRNHDGAISPQEYQAWSVAALGGVYAPSRLDMDHDADGRITFEEFSAELTARAHVYDSNGDGVIEHTDLVRPPSTGDDVVLVDPQGNYGNGRERSGEWTRR
jgi:EF hand